uniref:Uncharacterized protein n=1 Tax=Rhizophora mucronata TaxID=61149 RepID=A0A2P2NIW6_RHIMU
MNSSTALKPIVCPSPLGYLSTIMSCLMYLSQVSAPKISSSMVATFCKTSDLYLTPTPLKNF